jgi:serine/threonine protein kinase
MDIIGKKYKLLEKIGEGSFGLIFKGQNIRTGELVAIKMESIESNTKLLKNESIIYQFLNEVSGVPSVKWFGKDDNYYFMVLNLLGESLQSIKNQKYRFSLKLTLQIGVQTLNLLNSIHEKGLVHRDIKPDNFLIGHNEKVKNIYIIDFGFCKTFALKENNVHNSRSSLIGSPMYASINAHKLLDLTRRDDLESLGYMLAYFYLGSLEWQDNTTFTNEDYVVFKKRLINNPELPEVLIKYFKYVYNLEFGEKPNYTLLMNDFRDELERVNNY